MRNVDDYIDALPEKPKMICEKIRNLLFSLVPEIEERFSFKLPFYHYFGMFLYMANTKEGISVSFCRGKDLIEMFPQLETKNRAMVASVVITSPNDIYLKQLPEIISTAAAWNQEAKMQRIPMVKVARKKTARASQIHSRQKKKS